MENSIANGAIKIACIQTSPGKEFEVKNALENACKASKKIKKYLFLKGFGSFDIILLYLTNDFGIHLRTFGPIRHILKSNILLCFSYLSKAPEKIFETIESEVFTAFCLLKISPGLKNFQPNIDKMLRKYISTKGKKLSMLGSLGWSELIILISDKEINALTKQISEIGRLGLISDYDYELAVTLKTLSFIGINYNFLPDTALIKKGFNQIESFIGKNPKFNNSIINSKSSNLKITLEVTTKPIYRRNIFNYFDAKGFQVFDAVGSKDIIIRPIKKGMRWSFLLAAILDFRNKFKNRIFATSTRIGFDFWETAVINPTELPAKVPFYKFKYKELKDTFGETMASSLANHYYNYNALCRNPLCGSVYADMSLYPQYILNTGKTLKINESESLNYFVEGARDALKRGAELRSYGTHETIEEVTGRFSEFRGGCQLSLLAIEFFPSHILTKLKIPWMGFVVSRDPKFRHINEVINVPSKALWDPICWWALYHEVGHIIIDSEPDLLTYELPAIQQFLSNKNNHRAYFDFVIELTAEIIGFELGFFGDFHTYLTVLWEHLVEIDPFQRKNTPLEVYVIRTFFTEFFEGHFRKSSSARRVTKKEFDSLDHIYDKLTKHMLYIEKLLGKELFPDKYFIASKNSKLIKELYPYAKYLSKMLTQMKIRPRKVFLTDANTNKVYDTLKKGQIWWDKIKSPEAILYKLVCNSPLKFNTRISTILTFWNQQMLIYRKRFE